jgi:hypothetical protein
MYGKLEMDDFMIYYNYITSQLQVYNYKLNAFFFFILNSFSIASFYYQFDELQIKIIIESNNIKL